MELDCVATMRAGPVSADVIARVEKGAVGWCAPEVLRAQGENILKQGSKDAPSEAESNYSRSLALARQQGALSWEMRTATSLARLWRDQDRLAEARNLVISTYARFSEGLDTADVKTGR
jgi:predicted ATPase